MIRELPAVCRRCVGLVVAAAALGLAVSGQAQAATVTDTFKATHGAQSWTVPPGVTSVTFDVYGAAGEPAEGQEVGTSPTPGGTGAHVQATLAVTPGQVFEIVVGDHDGFNGGGTPGLALQPVNQGGGGGGASDVRAGACATSLTCDLSSRILVGGGGGGGGGLGISVESGSPNSVDGGAGGNAGATGRAGTGERGAGGGGGGGAGGSATGGSAGTGGTATGGDRNTPGIPGVAGMLGQGGAGGGNRRAGTAGGGGGGGGYYGGGGGGEGGATVRDVDADEGGGGGGGGGSSFVGPGAVGGMVAGNTGPNGDGLVQITYAAQDVQIAIAGRNGLLGRGVISVAVLSTSDFDARTIDPDTVCFGDAEDPTQRDCTEVPGRTAVLDMNHDRVPDLLLQFNTEESGIDPGDSQACLTGRTLDGTPIAGCATIVGIPTLLPLLGFPVFP